MGLVTGTQVLPAKPQISPPSRDPLIPQLEVTKQHPLKGYLTIPKRSQRIASGIFFLEGNVWSLMFRDKMFFSLRSVDVIMLPRIGRDP